MDVQSISADGKKACSSPAQLFIAMLNGQYKPAQQLIFLYKQQSERLLKNTAFYTSDKSEKGIKKMKSISFWRKLIEELVVNKEYTISSIAEELDVPREVIAAIYAGEIKSEPSFSLGIQLLELHFKVRSDLHQ